MPDKKTDHVLLWTLVAAVWLFLGTIPVAPSKPTPAPPPAITPVTQPRCFPEGTELPPQGFAACIDPVHTQQRST